MVAEEGVDYKKKKALSHAYGPTLERRDAEALLRDLKNRDEQMREERQGALNV